MAACNRSAGIPRAKVEVVAIYRREITSCVRIAAIERASIEIGANNRRVKTPAYRIAEIIGAGVGIIAGWEVNAIITNTGINRADIPIRRAQGLKYAYSINT